MNLGIQGGAQLAIYLHQIGYLLARLFSVFNIHFTG